jgi:hypothetical protein
LETQTPEFAATTPVKPSRAQRLLRTTLAILGGGAISVLFGALAFGSVQHGPDGWHYVPRMEGATVREALGQLSWLSVVLCVLITMASLPLRAIQWGEIVSPRGSFRDRYHATAIGFMAINTLPMNLGEVTRGLMLAYRVPGLQRSTSVGSVFSSRMFDIFALWLLAAPLPLVLQIDPASRTFLNGGLVALTGLAWSAMIGLWIAQRQAATVGRWLTKLLGTKVGLVLSRFLDGFGMKLSNTAMLRAMGWSVFFQAVTAFAYVPVIHSICPSIPPVSAAIYGLAAISVGLALPSTPSGAGVFHFAMASAMQSVGATPAQGLAIAIILHLGALAGFVLAGVLSLFATGAGAFKASLRDEASATT